MTPLIDESLGDELFGLQADAETTQMQQQIWWEVSQSIRPDLENTVGLEPEKLKADLHRIRGYCSTCAMCRLGKMLLDWESQPGVVEASEHYRSPALEIALLSVDAMEGRYPHLRKVPAKTSQ
jgi:hypothetical protein